DKIKIKTLKATNERKKEYLWIGNVMGVAPQNRLTTNNLKYLETKTISNILSDLQNKKVKGKKIQEFEDILQKIQDRFFIKSGKQPFLIPEKLEKVEKEGEKREKKGEKLLYTVAVEDDREVDLATHEGYIEYLAGSLLSLEEVTHGRCHICVRDGKVIAGPKYPSGTPLKIYAVDKKGFFSGLTDTEDAKLRTHAVCPDCLRALMAGNSYLMQNFSTKAGRFDVYLIPRISGTEIKARNLDKWAEYLSKTFGTVNSYEALHQFDQELSDWKEYEECNYFLNILFGRPEQAKFSFRHLIQDVPTTRLKKMRNENKRLSEEALKILPNVNWSLGFSEINVIYPIRISEQRFLEWKALIELFDAMLSAHTYPYDEIIKKALQFTHICRFGTYEAFNIRREKNPDIQMVIGVLKYNLLLKYLEVLDVVKSSKEGLEVSELVEKLPKDVKSWMELVSYSPQQQALFLLGILIGRIGTAQRKKGDTKKAILNKINFRGMNQERVMELANTVFENLRIYRVMEENEGLYSIMKQLLDANIGNWSMGPSENVFYILSGYSFATYKAIISKTQTES
ncbi:MAG: TIGR02556 family CRISPR-associated protein, partial [Candidatus Jordarchaeaceae archaeon]